jgi:hypothetical protein
VSVQESIPQEHWLALAGPEVLAEEAYNLAALPDTGPLSPRWPAVADRVRRTGGAVWRVLGEGWRLRLRSRTGEDRRVLLVLEEQDAAVLDGRRWTHRGTWRLFHRAGAELRFVLPAGAAMLAVTVDDAFVTPRQPSPDRLWVPLPAGGGVRTVRLVWVLEDGRESLEHPALDRPVVEGVPGAPVLWSVGLPSGYRLAAHGGGAVRASAAGQSLRRAAACLRLSQMLTEHSRPEDGPAVRDALKNTQALFYRWCQTAERQMGSPGWRTDDGPTGQPLAQWLGELAEQNRQAAQGGHFEEVRAAAEERGRGLPDVSEQLSGSGWVTYWQGPSGVPGLRLGLTSVEEESRPRTVLASLGLLLVLGGVWGLGRLPRVLGWVQFFWPEQLVGLGILVGQFYGLGYLLILPGVAGRMAYVASWLWAWGRAAGPAATPAPTGSQG